MWLTMLLLFCKALNHANELGALNDPHVSRKITEDLGKLEEGVNNGNFRDVEDNGSKDEGLPPLVPFEIPTDFIQKEGTEIIEAAELKMSKFFGFTAVNDLKNIESPEQMIEHLSKIDFHNVVVNYIFKKCVENLKPADQPPLDGITNKKDCKVACRNIHKTSLSFMHKVFESFISYVTNEDLRFRIYPDRKKCYEFSFEPEKNLHHCKCVEKAFKVEVSPRLLEIINTKIFNKKGGSGLAEELLHEPIDDVESLGSKFGLGSMGKLVLYFTGMTNTAVRWGYAPAPPRRESAADFLTKQFFISVFLFFFCHCIWYFHLVFVIFIFIVEYIF